MGAEQNDGDAENQAKDAGQFREFFCDALRANPLRRWSFNPVFLR